MLDRKGGIVDDERCDQCSLKRISSRRGTINALKDPSIREVPEITRVRRNK